MEELCCLKVTQEKSSDWQDNKPPRRKRGIKWVCTAWIPQGNGIINCIFKFNLSKGQSKKVQLTYPQNDQGNLVAKYYERKQLISRRMRSRAKIAKNGEWWPQRETNRLSQFTLILMFENIIMNCLSNWSIFSGWISKPEMHSNEFRLWFIQIIQIIFRILSRVRNLTREFEETKCFSSKQ